jgi:hypothetical protein
VLFNAIDDDELNIAYVYTCIHTLTYPNKDCFPTSLDGETQLNLLHYQQQKSTKVLYHCQVMFVGSLFILNIQKKRHLIGSSRGTQ